MAPFPNCNIDINIQSQVLAMHTLTSLLYIYCNASTHQHVVPQQSPQNTASWALSTSEKKPVNFLVVTSRHAAKTLYFLGFYLSLSKPEVTWSEPKRVCQPTTHFSNTKTFFYALTLIKTRRQTTRSATSWSKHPVNYNKKNLPKTLLEIIIECWT